MYCIFSFLIFFFDYYVLHFKNNFNHSRTGSLFLYLIRHSFYFIQANNDSLWLDGLEGALESNDAVTDMSNVTSVVEEHVQSSEMSSVLTESMAHITGEDEPNEGVSHSQEVETISMEPMEVDVQV